MQLTALEFASLLRDLKCDTRADERRGNPRAPTRTRLEVIPVLAGKVPVSQLLRVRDISRSGMGVLAPERIEEGRRFLVLLPKSATETFVLLCEVARVTRLPGDSFGIGLHMVRRVTDEDFGAFMRGNAAITTSLLTPTASATAA